MQLLETEGKQIDVIFHGDFNIVQLEVTVSWTKHVFSLSVGVSLCTVCYWRGSDIK